MLEQGTQFAMACRQTHQCVLGTCRYQRVEEPSKQRKGTLSIHCVSQQAKDACMFLVALLHAHSDHIKWRACKDTETAPNTTCSLILSLEATLSSFHVAVIGAVWCRDCTARVIRNCSAPDMLQVL